MAGFNAHVMDEHSFRQAQTAYSAYFFTRGGPFFSYETPLLGYPFSMPFELPIYQWLVGKFSLLSGLALDPAGRVVGRFFFYLALLPIDSLLRHFRVARIPRLASLTLYLFSPLYLYWSRTFMMESTALFFGLASCYFFLYYRNLVPLALAHAILGISVGITVPGSIDHNMRVGISYLTYVDDTVLTKPVLSAKPQRPD